MYSLTCDETIKLRLVVFDIGDLNGEEIVWMFCEIELRKTNQKEFRVEKVIKKKGNKIYFQWKGYDSFLNSSVDKKDII